MFELPRGFCAESIQLRRQSVAASMLCAAILLAGPLPCGAQEFIAVGYNSGIWRVNAQTGAIRPLDPTPPFYRLNSLAVDSMGNFVTAGIKGIVPVLVSIDPETGDGTIMTRLDFGETAVDIRALAFTPDDRLFALNYYPLNASQLFAVDPQTGLGTPVSPSRVTVFLQSLESTDEGELLTWGRDPGLLVIDPDTADFTDPFPDQGGLDHFVGMESIAFSPDGTLFGCDSLNRLHTIDLETGAATYVSTIDVNMDIRGIGFLPALAVDIDIFPFGQGNQLHLGTQQRVMVAIFGFEDFDVADVDVNTLAFGPDAAPALPGPPAPGQSVPVRDANGDGFADLLVLFDLAEAGIPVDATEACLTGALFDDTFFKGCDAVDVVPPHRAGP